MTPSELIVDGVCMKTEIEILAKEVRLIREKTKRPKYGPKLIARVVKLRHGSIDPLLPDTAEPYKQPGHSAAMYG